MLSSWFRFLRCFGLYTRVCAAGVVRPYGTSINGGGGATQLSTSVGAAAAIGAGSLTLPLQSPDAEMSTLY